MARARRQSLRPATSKGLNKERIQAKGLGKYVSFSKDNMTNTIQFFDTPENFLEYDNHAFRDEGKWSYVPCAGKESCPLCDDEDEDVSKTAYRFVANVYNVGLDKVQILGGPKTMAEKIFYRYERKPTSFLKRVFDITQFSGNFTSYQLELAEEKAVSLRGKKQYDLEESLLESMKAYYGDDIDLAASDLRRDDEDVDDEDDEDDDADDLDDDVDDEDIDDDDDADDADDDDDWDDDDDEEDESPPPTKRAKKAAPVKKAVRKSARKSSRTRA